MPCHKCGSSKIDKSGSCDHCGANIRPRHPLHRNCKVCSAPAPADVHAPECPYCGEKRAVYPVMVHTGLGGVRTFYSKDPKYAKAKAA